MILKKFRLYLTITRRDFRDEIFSFSNTNCRILSKKEDTGSHQIESLKVTHWYPQHEPLNSLQTAFFLAFPISTLSHYRFHISLNFMSVNLLDFFTVASASTRKKNFHRILLSFYPTCHFNLKIWPQNWMRRLEICWRENQSQLKLTKIFLLSLFSSLFVSSSVRIYQWLQSQDFGIMTTTREKAEISPNPKIRDRTSTGIASPSKRIFYVLRSFGCCKTK